MIIKQIELHNFRIYKGSNTINLEKDSEKNIFIVSGKNGFGKTTLLMSLVWCLFGRQMEDVDDLYKQEIAEQGGYSKFVNNALNRLAEVEGDRNFFVSITFKNVSIPELPCQEIKIIRSFNKLTSGTDQVEILIDGYVNELTNEVGPEIFIRDFLLPKEIAKFFFFDAEKIVSLAEVSTLEQQKKLSKAYSEVLGIKKYEDLKDELEELRYKLRKDAASFNDKQELIKIETEITLARNTIAENDDLLKILSDQMSVNKQEFNSIQEKLIRAGSFISYEDLQELKKREAELISKSEQLAESLKEIFDLVPFAIGGKVMLDVHNQLNTEAKIKAQQFQAENITKKTEDVINDLSAASPDSSDILIPFNVREFYANSLRKIIKKHFFADVPENLEEHVTLHDFSEIEKNEFNAVISNIKNSFKETFKRISGDHLYSKNELNSIRKKLRDAEANQEDPFTIGLKEQKKKLEDEFEAFQKSKIKTELLNEEKEKEVNIRERQKIDLTKKLEVSEQNKDKDFEASNLITYLQEFIKTFKLKKKVSLEAEILKGLNMLMHKKGFIKRVGVEIADDLIDIKLYNERNEEIRKGSLSKGEQQMYATALLRGLVEESDIEFPVFIDSPMQKFDEQHAENIVKHFYPSIADQVVIFPLLNKELSLKEFEMLRPNVAKTYLIDNINEDRSEFLAVETSDFIDTYNSKYNAN
jgi:DNA sulfur modification protein DndD